MLFQFDVFRIQVDVLCLKDIPILCIASVKKVRPFFSNLLFDVECKADVANTDV